MNIPKKKLALIVLLPLLFVGIVAAVTTIVPSWLGSEITTVAVPELIEPNITPENWNPTIAVNTYKEKDFTIHNQNNFPVLVNSLWTVTVTVWWNDAWGTWTIATDKYSVDDLQDFVWMKHIDTSPTDAYGLYNGQWTTPTSENEWYPLVIPAKGTATFTLVYHVPLSFVYGGNTYYFYENADVEVEWNPTFTLYDEAIYDFYDGMESWDNAYTPDWHP